MEIISRSEAKAAGLTWYYTGQPCKHGHVCERNVHDYKCVVCMDEYQRKYYELNYEKEREKNRKYREANPEKERDRGRKYRKANPEKIRDISRKYHESNSEKINEYQRKYYEGNPEKRKDWNRKYKEQNKRNESALDTLALLANAGKLANLQLTKTKGTNNEQ